MKLEHWTQQHNSDSFVIGTALELLREMSDYLHLNAVLLGGMFGSTTTKVHMLITRC